MSLNTIAITIAAREILALHLKPEINKKQYHKTPPCTYGYWYSTPVQSGFFHSASTGSRPTKYYSTQGWPLD
eukprot:8911225-Ditylum_brightwellii.AAC.1